MNKPNVMKYFKMVKTFTKKHSPEILTGIGIAGMVTTTVLAVKATPKALELIEEEKKRQNEEIFEKAEKSGEDEYAVVTKLKPLEVVKVTWKPYAPAVLLGVSSIGCLIGANSAHNRRHAALYSAYKISETALSEYKEKVIETVGEQKEKEIRDKVAKEHVEKNPVSKTEVFMTGKGESLFYDPISDRYFYSDIETIRKIVNDMNYAMTCGSEMCVSLSELYDELGLKHTSVSDEIGWNISDGLLEADFSTQLTDDGKPCIVLDWLKVPTYNYQRYY